MIGYNLVKRNKYLWKKANQALIPLTPPHVPLKFDRKKIKEILKEEKVLFIRWEQNFDRTSCKAWWHIIKFPPEDITEYDRKTRSFIRKADRYCILKPCSLSEISSIAYPVYKETYLSFDTHDALCDEDEFKLRIQQLPETTEFWGVFTRDENRLIAFSENIILDDSCFYNTMWITSEARKKSASFLLFHGMNNYYLNKKQLKYVSAGTKSISHKTNIQDFLQKRFNFRKVYSEINVAYVPALKLMVALFVPVRFAFQKSRSKVLQKIGVLLEQEFICRECNRK